MTWLKLQVTGMEDLTLALREMARQPADLRQAFLEVAQDFKQTEQLRFEREGPGWAPLSPNYARWKQQHFPGKPILQRTGRLMRSLTGQSGEYEQTITPHSLTIHSHVPYGSEHQTGTDNMPARPPIAISQEYRADLLGTFEQPPSAGSRLGLSGGQNDIARVQSILERVLTAEARALGLRTKDDAA